MLVSRSKAEKDTVCVFSELSDCRNQVAKYICNRHAELFNIIYEDVAMQTLSMKSSIGTYMFVTLGFEPIPLLRSLNMEIDTARLAQYANKIEMKAGLTQDQGKKLFSILQAQLGVSCNIPTYQCFNTVEWDNRVEGLYILNTDTNMYNFVLSKNIPALHKILFYHALFDVYQMSDMNGANKKYYVRPGTFGLVYTQDNEIAFSALDPDKIGVYSSVGHPCIGRSSIGQKTMFKTPITLVGDARDNSVVPEQRVTVTQVQCSNNSGPY